MDITPTGIGASVDVTDPAVPAVLEMLAEAYGREPGLVVDLLAQLADAVSARKNLRISLGFGRNVPDERVENAECEVDGLRDALAGHLSGAVTVELGAGGCLKAAESLVSAALAAQERYRTPGQPVPVTPVWLPQQADRRAA